MKSISNEEFFKQVAINSKVADIDVVEKILYGTVKTISQELKKRQEVIFPGWGKFYIKIHKSFLNTNVRTGERGMTSPRATIKFQSSHNAKLNFYSFFDNKE